ncbi:hypothetical protein CUZ56_00244 [Saezia sanguinis]|uniref:Uncharacterized protein n=1 Tax=Saezia sanguinis TaxID=1965230 RepID=A0A433SG88_9BURK|nr:hypothetical protein [Saezia sanguinis]RUS67767.1 hypothetical protein CUZ56_00244 [Saezia sanguinis]
MSIIVAPYPLDENVYPRGVSIFEDESHFIKHVQSLKKEYKLDMPASSLYEAVFIYNKVYGYSHCLVSKSDYQSSRQWSTDFIEAARSLGWYHADLDWIYKPDD